MNMSSVKTHNSTISYNRRKSYTRTSSMMMTITSITSQKTKLEPSCWGRKLSVLNRSIFSGNWKKLTSKFRNCFIWESVQTNFTTITLLTSPMLNVWLRNTICWKSKSSILTHCSEVSLHSSSQMPFLMLKSIKTLGKNALRHLSIKPFLLYLRKRIWKPILCLKILSFKSDMS